MLAINGFLFFLEFQESPENKILIGDSIAVAHLQQNNAVEEKNPEKPVKIPQNIFEKIDSALVANSFSEKWIRNQSSDTLQSKTVRVPSNLNMIKYNQMIFEILSAIGIKNPEVNENEQNGTLNFDFKIENNQAARLIIRKDLQIKQRMYQGSRIAIIIDDFGYQWGPQFVRGYIDFPVPITLSVIPGHYASKKTAEEATLAGKEVLIHLPMQPLKGSIAKESIKITSDMDDATISEMIKKAVADVPGAVGINNHEGSAGTSDLELMNRLFKVIKKLKLFFIDSLTSSKSVVKQAALENGVKFAERRIFLDNESDPQKIATAFRQAVELLNNGEDVIVIGHVRPATYKVLFELVTKEYPDLNYANASDMVK